MSVANGATQTCTITNTKRGHIVVDKVTLPAGDPQSFQFTTTAVGYQGFSLTDAAAPNNQEVVPGAYSATEGVVEGWKLNELTCNDQNSVADGSKATINVEPGETVTCTFTNAKLALIKVVKQLVPEDDPGTFNLSIGATTYDNNGAGYSDNQDTGFHQADAGSITVGEADHGTTKTSSYVNNVACDSEKGSKTNAVAYTFDVAYGEVVTCTFTNERKPSSIDVTKTPDPTSINEPGGKVKYTVTVENTSAADDVRLTQSSFVDKVKTNGPADTGVVTTITDLDCNGADPGDGLPLVLTPSGGAHTKVTCTFSMDVAGNAGDHINDRITVTGKDQSNRDVVDYAEASVLITDVPSSIVVTKTPTPGTVSEPGGNVTLQRRRLERVHRLGHSRSATPDTIGGVDRRSSHGDCTGQAPGVDSLRATTLGPSDTDTCHLERAFTGNPGVLVDPDVMTTGTDDEDGTTVRRRRRIRRHRRTPLRPHRGAEDVMATTGEDDFGETVSSPEPGGDARTR